MSEIIERAMRAGFAAWSKAHTGHEWDLDKADAEIRNAWMTYTRAVIGAMREPTPAMELAAEEADETGRAGPAEHWRAMIDDALK